MTFTLSSIDVTQTLDPPVIFRAFARKLIDINDQYFHFLIIIYLKTRPDILEPLPIVTIINANG